MKDFELEEKLAQLRKKWREAKNPIDRRVIEKRARALEIASEKAGDVSKKIRGIFR